MNPSHGFHDLVARAQAGDPRAIEELLAFVRPLLEQSARGYADAEHADQSTSDLAQEAWLRAWQKLGQFKGAEDDQQTLVLFQAWVRKIVRRLGMNAVRHREAQQRKPPGKLRRLHSQASSESGEPGKRLDPVASDPTPSAHAAGDEQTRLLQAALEKLSDATEKEILRLRFFEGLSLRQIARQLRINPETVRQRYHALLERLEHELKDIL